MGHTRVFQSLQRVSPVKERVKILRPEICEGLRPHIGGICRGHGHKAIEKELSSCPVT